MNREIADFIQDILDGIGDIKKFTDGFNFESFSKDKKGAGK